MEQNYSAERMREFILDENETLYFGHISDSEASYAIIGKVQNIQCCISSSW
jgi:hypothetical protein